MIDIEKCSSPEGGAFTKLQRQQAEDVLQHQGAIKPGLMGRIFGEKNAEIFRFLLVGGSAAAADFLLYVFIESLGYSISLSKASSFILAGIVAFLGNKYFTFENRSNQKSSALLFVLLYASTLGLNVLVNEIVLAILGVVNAAKLVLAWTMATATSAVVNFVGLKFIVFKVARPGSVTGGTAWPPP